MPTTKEMKTWTVDGSDVIYEIVDAKARAQVATKQNLLKGTSGQVVGFDASGNAVAQTVPGSGILITVTATATSWANKALTVSDKGFLVGEQYVYILGLDESVQADYAGGPIWADDVSTAGKMTLHTKEDQEKDLVLNILRLEVKNG